MSENKVATMPFSDYEAACDAIRAKTGTNDLIKSGEMAGLIEGIEGEGSAIETFTISCDYTNGVTGISFYYIDKNLECCEARLGFYENCLSVEVLKNSLILFTYLKFKEDQSGGFLTNDIRSDDYIYEDYFERERLGCKVRYNIHFNYYPSELGNEPT